jgi:hypothetical protein
MSIRDRILARGDLEELRAARDLTGLAAALNAEGIKAPQQRFVTARAIMAECPGGVAILAALKSAAADPAVSWALQFLGQEAGLDVGDPYTQSMIGQLVTAGVLSAPQGEALKALALGPVIVDRLEVEAALYNRDTTEK